MFRSGVGAGKEEASGSGGVESSATDTAKTAQSKLSEGVQEVQEKGADMDDVASKKGDEMEKAS